MFNKFIAGTRIAAYATWILLFLSLLSVLPPPYSSYSIILFSMMITLHILGYAFIKLKYDHLNNVTFFSSMLIGYAHWLPMIVNQNQADPAT
ncbi:MAG: hypothetical protein ACJAYF_001775 [Arenicella sp.]|jgi:hypothetical protein